MLSREWILLAAGMAYEGTTGEAEETASCQLTRPALPSLWDRSSLRGRDCAHREGRDSYLPERPVGRGLQGTDDVINL